MTSIKNLAKTQASTITEDWSLDTGVRGLKKFGDSYGGIANSDSTLDEFRGRTGGKNPFGANNFWFPHSKKSRSVAAETGAALSHRVRTSKDLRSAKFVVDGDKARLEQIPTEERTGKDYRRQVLSVVREYHSLIREVYQYWSQVIRGGGRGPVRRSYDSREYKTIVREIWEDSLTVLQEFEKHNPDDKKLRQETVNWLYVDVYSSELAWESLFYDDLASDIGGEMARHSPSK